MFLEFTQFTVFGISHLTLTVQVFTITFLSSDSLILILKPSLPSVWSEPQYRYSARTAIGEGERSFFCLKFYKNITTLLTMTSKKGAKRGIIEIEHPSQEQTLGRTPIQGQTLGQTLGSGRSASRADTRSSASKRQDRSSSSGSHEVPTESMGAAAAVGTDQNSDRHCDLGISNRPSDRGSRDIPCDLGNRKRPSR